MVKHTHISEGEMLRTAPTLVCRMHALFGGSSPALSLIRAFSAQQQPGKAAQQQPGKAAAVQQPKPAAGGAPQQKQGGKPPAAPPASLDAAVTGFLDTVADPLRPSTIVVQLRAKAYHPFYLNRYAVQLSKKFGELGLAPPGQVFLPKKYERWTLLKSPHVDKKAREQFERITHKRMFQFKLPDSQSNVEFAYRVLSQITALCPGVEVRAKYLVSAGGSVRG